MSTLERLPGLKVGMTQVFDSEKRTVIPVTVVSCPTWYVTQVKTEEADGYTAVQAGLLRKRYREQAFDAEWLKKKSKYFLHIKELPVENVSDYSLGQALTLDNTSFEEGDLIAVSGKSVGKGFQGVVKRWNFSGGNRSHGSMFGRLPGSIGNMTSQGNVIKGKKLPGHMGNKRVTVKGLRVVKVDKERNVLYVKGAMPGRKNSLLYIAKQG